MAASKAYMKGKRSQCGKILTSHGVGRQGSVTGDNMRKMHPPSKGALELPAEVGPQDTTDPVEMAKALRKATEKTSNANGVFGYNTDTTVYTPKSDHQLVKFEEQTARLMAIIADGSGPPALAAVATFGSLTPLNKIAEEENDERIAKGERPLQRPINKGSQMTRTANHYVSRTDSAKAAKSSVLPLNVGIGVAAGSETIASTFQHIYEMGGAINSEDANNGFNELSRQKMLEAVAEKWRQRTRSANFHYGGDALVIYVYVNEEGNVVVVALRSESGARMGDTFGSLYYGLTLAPTYENLQDEFPRVVFLAHTDDLPKGILPPDDGDWNAALTQLADANDRFDQLANPLGITRNTRKSQLLIPAECPEDCPALARFSSWTKDGIVVVGAAIGTPEFEQSFLTKKLIMVMVGDTLRVLMWLLHRH